MFLGNVSLDPLSPYELPVAPSMALKRVAPVVQAVNELAVEMFPGRFPDEERFRTGRVLLKPEESPNEAITLTSLWICALRSKWLIYEVRTKFIGINTRDGRELRHRLVTMSRVVQRCVDGVLVHAMTCPDEYDLCSSLFTTRWEIDPTQLHLRV